ncbi:hypothetical protein BTO05_11020 [Winogradskyella sp. PC-19]|uniref:hypothetical protein n=1 Tax=Winogradskyella sp. PC-19 TaxID=754417 RepID=UPI000B3CC98C|nr:hypothetical protein [Winogradskyella sp. PC-19]ARV10142.1 hypothetical protein BTO05_11020 [Winogradskyella sp. PC-19]
MKKTLNLSILFISILLLASCNTENNNKRYDSSDNIRIIDSFKIGIPQAIVADINKDKILAYNMISNDIVIFDIAKKKQKKFNKYGNGYDEFMASLQPYTLNFIKDSLVGISSVNKIKVYNSNGLLKDTYQINNNNTSAPLSNFEFLNDSTLVAVTKPQGDNSKRSYYNQNHQLLLKFNTQSDSITRFAEFPLPESDLNLKDEDFYYPYPFIYFNQINKNEMEYSLINSNDSNLYLFDINSTNLKSIISLDLDHYKPLKKPFNNTSNSSQNMAMMEFFMNSTIVGYHKNEKFDFIIYNEAIERDKLIEHFKKNDFTGPNFVAPKSKLWLHKLENGQKKSSDILLPSKYGFPIHINSENQAIFSKPISESDDYNGTSTFYIYELNPTEE